MLDIIDVIDTIYMDAIYMDTIHTVYINTNLKLSTHSHTSIALYSKGNFDCSCTHAVLIFVLQVLI